MSDKCEKCGAPVKCPCCGKDYYEGPREIPPRPDPNRVGLETIIKEPLPKKRWWQV